MEAPNDKNVGAPSWLKREEDSEMSRHKAVLFIIDGCRSDYLDQTRIDTIGRMMDEGTTVEDCRTTFPSMTHPAHTSIVTGLYPSNHGIVSHDYYDRGCRRLGTFLTYNKFRGKSVAELVKSVGGTVVSVDEFTCLGRGADLYVNVPIHDVQEVTYQAIDAISRKNPDLLLVTYFASDDTGSGHGPQSEELKACIKEIDKNVGTILNKAQETWRDKELLFVLSSDHGMVETGEPLFAKLRQAMGKSAENPVLLSEGLYAQLYVEGDARNAALEVAEVAELKGLDVILEKEELKALNCFDELIGDVVMACREGFNLIEEGKQVPPGLHGSLVEECMKVPLIIWGSGVAKRTIAFTIARFMGLEYPNFDGRPLMEAFNDKEKAKFDEKSRVIESLAQKYHQKIGLIRQMSELKKERAEGRLTQGEFEESLWRLRDSLNATESEYERIKMSLEISLYT
ncbi:MAG: alkaline phosphatase family protein [Candidatus Bathyarchaeia archaeon]